MTNVGEPYVGERVVYDADSHVMELPGWLEQFADAATAGQLRPLALGGTGALADRAVEEAAGRRAADYPHPEGTKNPIERFESTIDDHPETVRVLSLLHI